jgi:hypothetical protein
LIWFPRKRTSSKQMERRSIGQPSLARRKHFRSRYHRTERP